MYTLITGASSGIGEACARVLAANHQNLILIARRSERLQSLAEELKQKYSIIVHPYTLDVRNYQDLQRLVNDHPEIFSKVENLINNAGLARGLDPIQELKAESWDEVIDTNIKGLLSFTRTFVPQMIARKNGHIVNIGSVAGYWVYEKGNVYCASKFAVRALTEGLRLDLNGTGIRVTEISPGMVETEFSEVRYQNKERGQAVYAGRSPLKPEDIAETVLWCINRPRHVNIQEVIIFPTEQAGVHTRAR